MQHIELSVLLGETINNITGAIPDSDEIYFTLDNGKRYKFYHSQDCCEHVGVRSVEGDISDLIGHPLTLAEVSTNSEDQTGIEYHDSFTWTFYRFATIKGYVTITWLGQSNGYYSEEVSFTEINDA